MKLLRGYLAHPLLNRVTVRKWELNFEKRTGIDLINPFYDIARDDGETDYEAGAKGNYEHCDHKEIVDRDLAAILGSEFIVAFVTGQRSYGTIMEICYAYSMDKPVFIICENGYENHPWLVYHSNKIFKSTAEFRKYIQGVNDGLTT